MKTHLLLLFFALTFGTALQAQVIFDWETPETSGTYQYFGSTLDGSQASAIANPNPTGVNTSSMVLEFTKPAGAQVWAGAFAAGDGPGEIDCTTGGQICVDVHMSNLGNLGLKLENATTGGANWITTQSNTVTGEWETLCFDLSVDGLEDDMTNAVGDIFTQLVLFADFGTPGGDEDQTYYFDNIVLIPGGVTTDCIFDWESPETTGTYQFFGSTLDGSVANVIDNPNPTGVNESSTVLEFVKPAGAEVWAGAFAAGDGPGSIDCTNGGQICVDVHMDHLGNLAVKLENATTGGANWITTQNNTVINEWETLCFDLSVDGLEDDMTNAVGDIFTQLVLFVDFGTAGTDQDVTTYIDNICLEAGSAPQKYMATFNVNMNGETVDAGVFLSGGLINNWSPDATPMDDSDGDGIYTVTVELAPAMVEYKFVNGATYEELEEGDCTITDASGQFTNRLLTMEAKDTIVDAYVFGSCDLMIVDVDETIFDNNLFTIAPNPAMDEVSVTCDVREEKLVTILDINGSVIQQFTMAANQSTMNVTLNDIASGMYIMTVTSDKTRSAQKFIKR